MAGPVEHPLGREALNLMAACADQGEPLTLAVLQENLGLGHDDANAMMSQLVEQSMATEIAPGEWGPVEAEDREPVRVRVDRAADEERPPERDGVAARVMETLMPEPTVRLNRAIADELDANALGQLVKAGLKDFPEERVFWLEISP